MRLGRLVVAALGLVLTGWTAWIFARFVPPFLDLPQHAWTLTMLRHPEAYADVYVSTLRPWNTNTFWFVLDGALAPFVSPEGSLALACFLAVSLLPLALATWAGALGRDAALAYLLGWIVTWTRSLHWGFVNYALSMSTAIFALAADAALQRRGPGRRGWRRALVVAAVALTYLQHAQTWAFLLGMLLLQRLVGPGLDARPDLPSTRAGPAGLADPRGRGRPSWLGLLPLVAPSVLLFLPFALTNLVAHSDGGAPLVNLQDDAKLRFGDPDVDWKYLLENAAATVRWSDQDEALVRAVLAAAAAGLARALLRKDDPGRRGIAVLPLLSLTALVAYLWVPLHVLGQFQIASRMAPWVVLLLVPAAAPVLAAWARRAGLALAGGGALLMVQLQTGSFERFAAESAPVFALMAKMEPGRTASLWAQRRGTRSSLGAVYTHILGWYAARTLGRAQFSFAEFRPNPVVYRDPTYQPRVRSGEEFRAWCAVRAGDGAGLDYVLVRDAEREDATCGSVTQYRDALREVERRRDWTLYEVVGPLPAAPSAACHCKKRPRRPRPR